MHIIISNGDTYRWVVVGIFWLGLVVLIVRTHPKPHSMLIIPIKTSLGHTKITTPTVRLLCPFRKVARPPVSGVLSLPRFFLRSGWGHSYKSKQNQVSDKNKRSNKIKLNKYLE
jgi:hypothetical protein